MNKRKRNATILGLAAALLGATYPFTIKKVEEIVHHYTPRISQVEAEKVLQEERKNLGIREDIPIRLLIYDKELDVLPINGFSGYNEEIGAVIGTTPAHLKRSFIRHELYHLVRDNDINTNYKPNTQHVDLDDDTLKENAYDALMRDPPVRGVASFLGYMYGKEARASLYSFTGIKF